MKSCSFEAVDTKFFNLIIIIIIIYCLDIFTLNALNTKEPTEKQSKQTIHVDNQIRDLQSHPSTLSKIQPMYLVSDLHETKLSVSHYFLSG